MRDFTSSSLFGRDICEKCILANIFFVAAVRVEAACLSCFVWRRNTNGGGNRGAC